jgi:transcriptional regulator of heat shock response
MVTIEKEKIMGQMLNSLRERTKFYRDTTTKDLANIHLGELHGFEIYFNIVGARGTVSDETIKTGSDFRKELEEIRQILSKKFESGELK